MDQKRDWSETPWHIERYKEPYTSSLDTYIVVSRAGLIVAKCGTGDFEIPSNARLISAAPKLLDALEGVVRCMETDAAMGHAIDRYYYDMAKNAISEVYTHPGPTPGRNRR